MLVSGRVILILSRNHHGGNPITLTQSWNDAVHSHPSISAPRAYGICSDLTWTIHTARSHRHQLISVGAIDIGTADWWPLKDNTDQSSVKKKIVQQMLCCMLKLVEILGDNKKLSHVFPNHVSELRIAHQFHQFHPTTKAHKACPKKEEKPPEAVFRHRPRGFSGWICSSKLGRVTLQWLHLSSKQKWIKWATKNYRPYFPLYWLVNRDP